MRNKSESQKSGASFSVSARSQVAKTHHLHLRVYVPTFDNWKIAKLAFMKSVSVEFQ
jgi:hypothetical protein